MRSSWMSVPSSSHRRTGRPLRSPGAAIEPRVPNTMRCSKGLAMPGIVVDPLPDRAVLEVEDAEHGILAGGLDRLGEVLCPRLPEPAGAGAGSPLTDLLEETRLSESRRRRAEIVLEDIGVVDAGVEGQRARDLHVPPGVMNMLLRPPTDRFHDELPLTDRLVVQQRADQPVDRVAPEILGNREDPSVSPCGVDDQIAAPDRQGEGLLAHRVKPEIEQRDADAMMCGRVGGAVGPDQALRLPSTSARRR